MRPSGRDPATMREVRFVPDFTKHAEGSVLASFGDTQVLCTASIEERAERRYNQLIGKGINAILRDLLRELQERDARDSEREVSPLKPAEDAYTLDTTALTIDEVVEKVMGLIAESTL